MPQLKSQLSTFETPEFVGRVIAALHADLDLALLSGKTLIAAELVRRYGLKDTGDREPASPGRRVRVPHPANDVDPARAGPTNQLTSRALFAARQACIEDRDASLPDRLVEPGRRPGRRIQPLVHGRPHPRCHATHTGCDRSSASVARAKNEVLVDRLRAMVTSRLRR